MGGAGERNRTPDLFITSELLYRLSYSGLSLPPTGAQLGMKVMRSLLGTQPYYNFNTFNFFPWG